MGCDGQRLAGIRRGLAGREEAAVGALRQIVGTAAGAATGLVLASAATAADTAAASQAAAFDTVMACRKIADAAQRLTCVDAALAALDAAVKAGDVVVVDRPHIHEAKRRTFGLPSLDSLDLLNRGERPEVVEKISGVIAKASQDREGKWVLETQDGQVWSQTNPETFAPDPQPGDRIEIRRGMLGGYFIKINGRAWFTAQRDR
jgi:hypothetical protein